MDEYIKREDAIDAVLDVYCDTPDIDLSCEKFEAAILKIPAADVVNGHYGDGVISKSRLLPTGCQCQSRRRRNTMQNELRECPFCGNLHVLLRNIEYDKTLWIIECNVCHTEFTVKRVIAGKKKDNRSRVIETWNRRANDDKTE